MADKPRSTEFEAGVRFWRAHAHWDQAFHNRDYSWWAANNPNGEFTDMWWEPFLQTLSTWRAIRPTSKDDITNRFRRVRPLLASAWRAACDPYADSDISMVTWEEVKAFAEVVASLKPTKSGSPVFASKFCHFLLPKVFPVADDEALGAASRSYESFFRRVQSEWTTMSASDQQYLLGRMTALIEEREPMSPHFPMANKIVELRLIGRRHP